MRAEVKLGLGVSAVICTVVGGYFMFGRQKESNIPVNGAPVAANTPAKPGTPNKTDAAKTPATNPNKGRTTPQTKPTTPTTSNPRLASGQPGSQPGTAQPNTNPTDPAHPTRTFPAATTANPNPTPTTNPTTTPATSGENPSLAAGQPKPVWPPANNEPKTDTVASRTPTDQPATQGPPTMPQTTLSATSSTPTVPNSEVNQPVKSPTPADSNVSDPRNTLASMQPNRVPPTSPQPTVGSNPTTSPSINPQPASVPPTSPAGEAKLTSMKADDAAVETHKVQPGDTFAKLAESYYGDVKLEQFLKESNKDLGDPRRISLGMVVKIPPKPGAGNKQAKKDTKDANDTKDAAKPTAEKSKSTGAKTYTVKSGDSFYSIAKAQLGNSARWKQLYALNKKIVDNDPTNLRPGQVLKLPEEEAAKTTP